MLDSAVCEREIRELHAFFADWYRGDRDRASLERLETALASDFSRVAPDGTVAQRQAVLDGIESAYDSATRYDITIEAVVLVEATPERALVRYDEWQSTPDGENGRRSTALFAPSTHDEVAAEWRALHETWLASP